MHFFHIVASIFAGAISSVASFVNSLAAVTLEEVIRPFILNRNSDKDKNLEIKGNEESIKTDEKRAVIYSKILGVLYGLLCLIIAYLCEQINRLLETALALFGIAGGPTLAVFTLGISFRKCNANGAIFGFVLALLIGIVIGFGPILTNQNPKPLPRSTDGCAKLGIHDLIESSNRSHLMENKNSNDDPWQMYIFKISYMWICPLTWLITTVIALIYSYFLPDPNLTVSDDLLMPILRKKNPSLIV